MLRSTTLVSRAGATRSRFAVSTSARIASRRAFHTTRAVRSAEEDPLKADLKAKGIPIPQNMPPSKFDHQAMLEEEYQKFAKSMGGSVFPDAEGMYPDVKKLGDLILGLNMVEMQQLFKYIQKKLGLPEAPMMGMPMMGGGMPMMGGMPMQQQPMAAAQPAAAAAPEAAAAPAKEEPKVEKTEFNLKLEKFAADKKLQIIKELRVVNKDIGIKEAKELVESAPCVLLKNVKKEEAEKLKARFEELGGTIVLE